MASKMLEAVIRVKDEASKALKDIKNETGKDEKTGLIGSFKSLSVSALAAAVAIQKIAREVMDAAREFTEYARGVDKLGEAFGLTTHEAETLMHTADAMGVSNDALFSSMNKLAREGMGTGVEALGNLREAFLAIQDPAAAAEYLFGMVGEQGQKAIAPLLTMSQMEFDEFIEQMELSAQLTEEQVDAADDLAMSMSELNMAWEGLTNNIMSQAAPALTNLLDGLQAVTIALDKEKLATIMVNNYLADLNKETHGLGFATKATAPGVDMLASKLGILESAANGAANGLSNLNRESTFISQQSLLEMKRVHGEDSVEYQMALGLWRESHDAPSSSAPARRYGGGGGGGGGGMTPADTEELMEDLLEAIEKLPVAIADAIERSSTGLGH